MREFERSLHIPMDNLREWVKSGFSYPLFDWRGETNEQFLLARENAAHMARRYADRGYAVAIDDLIFPRDVPVSFAEPLADHQLHRALLHPPLETALERNARRTSKDFDPSALEKRLRRIHRAVEEEPFEEQGWIVVDNSDLTAEAAACQILRQTELREVANN